MTPRFPNSAFVKTPERFVLSKGRWTPIALPVRYGYFEHPTGGKCLIDTGYSPRTLSGRRSLPLWLYANILRPKLTDAALPKAVPVVDTIILTHLHADHVSALKDYPDAVIYADKQAVDAFLEASWFGRTRHGVFAELLPEDFTTRIKPFESLAEVEAPFGLGNAWDVFNDGAVLAVPLPGHMRGHTGVLWPQRDTPLLYAADAEWLIQAVDENRSPGRPAQWILDDIDLARQTAERLRDFKRAGGDIVLCHDAEIET